MFSFITVRLSIYRTYSFYIVTYIDLPFIHFWLDNDITVTSKRRRRRSSSSIVVVANLLFGRGRLIEKECFSLFHSIFSKAYVCVAPWETVSLMLMCKIPNVLVPDCFCRLHKSGRIRNKTSPVWLCLKRFWIRNFKLQLRLATSRPHEFQGRIC